MAGPPCAPLRGPNRTTLAAPRSGRGLPWPMLPCGKICGSACNKNNCICQRFRQTDAAPRLEIWHLGSSRSKEAAAVFRAVVLPPGRPPISPCRASCSSWQPCNVASSEALDGQPRACSLTNTRPGEPAASRIVHHGNDSVESAHERSRTGRRDRKLPTPSALLKRLKIAPIGRKRPRPSREIPANRAIE
jgi:hypothetical protein